MRASVVVRLSRVTDATTSPERQVVTCRELCDKRGYGASRHRDDLDVSTGTSRFDRPQLGDWLENRRGEFDVIVFYGADRIVRRRVDLPDLIRWSRERHITLVSATESHFDLATGCGMSPIRFRGGSPCDRRSRRNGQHRRLHHRGPGEGRA
jgi:site-specific DNA recombinase